MIDRDWRVLIVDDDRNIRHVLSVYYQKQGYETAEASDGHRALEVFDRFRPDLVVLDRMLPSLSGERVLRSIRERSSAAVILISAKTEVEDRIIGLELGADDYIPKPFSPRELLARSAAVLRRMHDVDEDTPKKTFGFGDLEIDVPDCVASYKGEPIPLTVSEFRILAGMAAHPGRVFEREELLAHALGDSYTGRGRAIDSHIKNLRSKLAACGCGAGAIKTVHGVGYRFDETEIGKGESK